MEDVQACENILQLEINASTDNPLVFTDTGAILHGGNFHAIYQRGWQIGSLLP